MERVMRLGVSPERLLDALADAAPHALLRFYTPNCCLDATALAVDILGDWRIKAEPVLCTVSAFNKDYLEGGRGPEAACLLIDVREEAMKNGDGIYGHLVCTGKIGSDRFLLDLSAFQFHRGPSGGSRSRAASS
jgi:hypothetical protein